MTDSTKRNSMKWRYPLVSTIIFIAFMILVLPRVSAYTESLLGEVESPDTSIYYSSEDLYNIAESYGEEGRSTYIRLRWTFDLIWPAVYTFFLISWLIVLTQYGLKERWRKYIIALPILGITFDIMENTGATIVMLRYPQTIDIIARLTPIMTLLKWISISLSFVAILILGLIALVNRIRRAKNGK